MFAEFANKSALLFVFFVHGVVFGVLLLAKGLRTDNRSSVWLSGFTLLCTLYITPFMLGYAGWYSAQPYRDILFYLPLQQVFALPPLLYFYVRSLLDRSFRFSATDALHFVPAAGYLLYSVVVFVTDKLVLGEYFFYASQRDKDLLPWYQAAGLVSMVAYLLACLRLYQRYARATFEVLSFADTVLFRWIQRFLVAFLLLIALRVLFFVLNPEWDEFGRKFWYYFCFSVLFYYISVSGYLNSVQTLVSLEHVFRPAAQPHAPLPEAEPDLADLPEQKNRIEALMRHERLFENPTLTLNDVAERMALPPKKVSQVVNVGFKMNFNDFVNGYRSEAVIEKLRLGEHSLQTLLGIALDCGFNSKSTFNRAFKKYTQLSPKEYLAKYYPK